MPSPNEFLHELGKLREANHLARRMLNATGECSNYATHNSSTEQIQMAESSIDEMVPHDIWGAGEYLNDASSRIDYVKDHLKMKREILRKSHALLHVPKKCSYQVVESTEELFNVDAKQQINASNESYEDQCTCNDRNSGIMETDENKIFQEQNIPDTANQTTDKTSLLPTEFMASCGEMLASAHGHSQHQIQSLDSAHDCVTCHENAEYSECTAKKTEDTQFLNHILSENEAFSELVPLSPELMSDTSDSVAPLKETQDYSERTPLDYCSIDCSSLPCNSTDLIPQILTPESFDSMILTHDRAEKTIEDDLEIVTSEKQSKTKKYGKLGDHDYGDNLMDFRSFEPELAAISSANCAKQFTFPSLNSQSSNVQCVFDDNNENQPLFNYSNENLDKRYELRYPKQFYPVIPFAKHQSVWDTLPNEIVLLIFSFLSQRDLKQIAEVCHRFYAIAKDHYLWSKLNAEGIEISSSWLENFCRVQQASITRSRAKKLSNKALREFFQNSKDTLKFVHLSQCKDKYLYGDNILLHVATHCRKLNSISLPWSNTTDNGIDALTLSNLTLNYLDISGNCYISDSSFIKLLKKNGAILKTLKINGCFALTMSSFTAIADHCQEISILEIGLCPKIGKHSIILISSVLKNLTELDLRGLNCIDDNCLSHITNNCKLLTKLVLANCKSLTDNGISNLGYDLPNMTSLDLTGCPNISDDGCCNLASSLRSPTHLNFSSTSISHVSILVITENFYHSLQSLKISFCNNITQECLEKLTKFCVKLNLLHIHGCKRIDVKKLQENHATLLINK